MKNFKTDILKIKAFVFDVDGVLSCNEIMLHPEDGEPLRTLNIKDGYALQYAMKSGYKIAIITGCSSLSVLKRFENLGIEDIYMASSMKKKDIEHFVQKYRLNFSEILYMGDDIPDYEAMSLAGIPTCPKDAAHEIKKISAYISPLEGGKGCVRDVIEQTMKAQKCWMNTKDAFYW